MKLTQTALTKIRWYRQGGAIKLGYISVPWNGCHDITVGWRRQPRLRQQFLIYFKNDFATLFLNREDAQRLARYYIAEENRHPGFVGRLHRQWQRRFFEFRDAIVSGKLPGRLEGLSNDVLLQAWQHAIMAYNNLWREAIFHDSFDVVGESLLEQTMKRFGRQLLPHDILTLIEVREPMPIQEERASLARLADVVARSPRLRLLVKHGNLAAIQTSFPEFSHRLAVHARAYFWIHNDYAQVERLTEHWFLKAISELLRESNKLHADQRILQTIARTAKRQRRLKRRLKLPAALVRLTDVFSIISVWRDERKTMNQLGDALMQQFYREFGRRGRVPLPDAEYACFWEMPRLLKPTATFCRQLKERRRGTFAYFTGRQNLHTIGGRRGAKLLALMNSLIAGSELKGRCAYPGRVTGAAKRMFRQQDFKRFRKGDILIAPNTRPEYVPIMKIAAAIVTEEGGITSHAAIVSRELKKPAVVGVQGIWDVFKDGDRVEVDATKGVVRRL